VIEIGAATLMFAMLAVLLAFGVQVAVALGVVSIAAVYAMTGEWQAVSRVIVTAAYDGLRTDALIAIPLFMLMGEFIIRSGAVADLFQAASRAFRAIPGGAALAGAIGNALYAFAAGGSIAGAAGFARISYGELRRRGYDRAFSLGTLASASALGMLLPPSVLMVTWGILGGQPVGAILLAALIPAVLIVLGFAAVLVAGAPKTVPVEQAAASLPRALGSLVGIVLVFVAVLGGIGARVLSLAEAASVGAAIGLTMALAKGMRPGAIVEAILAVGRASAPVLLLILAALIYAQAVALTGAGPAIQAAIGSLGPAPGLAVMVAVWLVLATVLDSLSAVALTAALFAPAALVLGIDPLAFAVIGIVVLEAAPLLPPLGLLVFATKAAVDEHGVRVLDIFRHVLPFLAILLAAVILLAAFPKVAIWLPYSVQ
jgi:C4-dicarboxylate transporter DctM subunit